MVIGQGMRITPLWVLLGISGTFSLAGWLFSLLFEITPFAPSTVSAASFLLLVVALITCWIPAHRAANVDPIQALRQQ